LRNYGWILTLLILLGLTICAPVVSVEPVPPVVPASGTFEKYGPRVDRLIFSVCGRVEEVIIFEQGLVDLMDVPVPRHLWDDWLADPEITMGEYEEFAAIYLALNNMRWPIGHGDQLPTHWSSFPEGYVGNHSLDLWNGDPTSSDLPVGTADMTYVDYDHCQRCNDSRWFRRGLAHMVDRACQIAYMEGVGVALNRTLFWPALKDWEYPNGYAIEYAYNLTKARACFEAGGFKDWDNDDVMEYSPVVNGSRGSAIEELPTLQFYVCRDDDHSVHASQLLSADMHQLGIPHYLFPDYWFVIAQKVWSEYDYDIYIEYRDWTPTPDFYAEWFMSRKDIYPDPWGDNEHRYHSQEFDLAAEFFLNATGSEAAKPYCYKMQEIIHRDVAAIPFYCYVGYVAHRTNYGHFYGEEKYWDFPWQGFVNEMGVGFHSFWTHLNTHPQEQGDPWSPATRGFEKGGTLRQGLSSDPELLDVMDSIYSNERLVLDRIYESLLKFNPYDPTQFMPWLCMSYEVGTWEHPTEGTCSAINFTLIPGVLWQDGEFLTWQDVNFSFWFTRECMSVNYRYAKDFEECVNYTDIIDLDHDGTPDTEVEVIETRFNVLSWLAPYWCSGVPIIPKHIWEPVGVWGNAAYCPEDFDEVIGTGPFRFYKDGVVGRVNRVPGEYLYLEPNPLYFRKYVWPDVCDETHTPCTTDGWVDIEDFMEVINNIFEREEPDGTWRTPWGPHCDVNNDGRIGIGDLMEIGVHRYMPWPPAWYVDC